MYLFVATVCAVALSSVPVARPAQDRQGRVGSRPPVDEAVMAALDARAELAREHPVLYEAYDDLLCLHKR